ncbi:hypothetical protein Bca52824_065363 [Brassica carinata]|uniref:Uncharacterized protein n=1 Tax=Brassica carinata TaxID=52824 RepID=A0A8X7QJK1_BRACI|nr:hypothetical protein Bca52824_065363 [Brassica carinata]
MSVTKGLWTRKKLMQRIGTAMIEHHSLSGSSYSIFFSYDRTSQPLRDGRNMVWNQNKEVSRGARSARQPNSVWKEMVKHIPTNGDRKKYHAE